MKILFIIVLLVYPSLCFSQDLSDADSIQATSEQFDFIKEFKIEADSFIGADDFDNIYYIKNNTLFKKTLTETYSYTNTQLGHISSVDIKNPLKVLLFYKNFNTYILLDNRLNELTRPINFNEESILKNIAFISFSSNNNLWLYSYDDNVLSLYNHLSKKFIFNSQPLGSYTAKDGAFIPVDMVSNYKKCWLVGQIESELLVFDEFGNFLKHLTYGQFDQIKPAFGGEILLRNNKLSFLVNHTETDKDHFFIKNNNLTVHSFYANKRHLYIFDGKSIFVYKYLKN